MRMFVCLGDPHEDHMKYMKARTTVRWTVNAGANAGNRVCFYMIAPRAEFVATGTVVSPVRKNNKKGDRWFGHYEADISKIKPLRIPVERSIVQSNFPDWKWFRQPRRSSEVPSEMVLEFSSLLESSQIRRPAIKSDIEGIQTEVVRLTSSRSKRLRNEAFSAVTC